MSRAPTCEDDQAVTLLSVPDLAASEQHVVQVQRVTLPVPQHRPHKLVQAVVRLLALDQSFRRDGRRTAFIRVKPVKLFKSKVLISGQQFD